MFLAAQYLYQLFYKGGGLALIGIAYFIEETRTLQIWYLIHLGRLFQGIGASFLISLSKIGLKSFEISQRRSKA